MAKKKVEQKVKTYAEQREEIEAKREALQKEIADKKAAFEKSIADQVALEKKLEEEQKALARQEQEEFLDFLRENRDVVLKMFKHDRTSCDDNHINNGFGSQGDHGYRCAKCALIELLNREESLRDDQKIWFDINIC